MSMFDNYPQSSDYIPNNRPRHCKHKRLDIMAGETAKHTFEVPFNVEEECDSFEVIYLLGIAPVIIKNTDSLEVDVEEHHSTITSNLTADETSIFANTLLEAKVQLKFFMLDDTITYSDIYTIKLKTALDASGEVKPIPPKPCVLGGLGYTED